MATSQAIRDFCYIVNFSFVMTVGINTDCFFWGGPGSSVGIATGYGLEGLVIESRWTRDFLHLSRPALGSIQPHVKCVSALSPGGKERQGRDADPSPPFVPWSRRSKAIPLLPLWTVLPVQSLSACTTVHFTFFFLKKKAIIMMLIKCNVFWGRNQGFFILFSCISNLKLSNLFTFFILFILYSLFIFINFFLFRIEIYIFRSTQ